MRFQLRQRFSGPADAVNRAYADPALYPALVGLPKLGGIEVLSHERDGETVRLAIRYAFTGDLPSAVTAVVDPRRLTWVQHSVHDLVRGVTTFRLDPDHYPDRLAASGSATVSAQGDGAQRLVAGDLKVRAPLVAGRVEEAIVSGLDEFFQAEAPAVDRYVAG